MSKRRKTLYEICLAAGLLDGPSPTVDDIARLTKGHTTMHATLKERQAVTILIENGTLQRDEWNQLRIVGRYAAVMTPYGAACRLEDDGWIWNDQTREWVAPGAAVPLYVNLAGEETTPATIDGKVITYTAGRTTYRMRFRPDDVHAVVVDGDTWYEVDADRLWEDWHDVDDRAAVEP